MLFDHAARFDPATNHVKPKWAPTPCRLARAAIAIWGKVRRHNNAMLHAGWSSQLMPYGSTAGKCWGRRPEPGPDCRVHE